MRTAAAALDNLKKMFMEAGIESAGADARILVGHVLRMSREDLLVNSGRPVSDEEERGLLACAQRRVAREPVSRILGVRSFWKSDFKITSETLDPRPETETIIEAALRHAPHAAEKVLDLGTGSGCLLLSLLQEFPKARGTGVDISRGAVEVAEENAEKLGLSERASFVAGSWETAELGRGFDVVVSNPPYIAAHEMAGLAPEVTRYDPHTALVAEENGLACYRSIISLLPRVLNPEAWVFLEIGHTQAPAVEDLLEQGGFIVLETAPDLAGKNRCIVARQGRP